MDAIQQVFQQDYESYRAGKRLAIHQVKAARNIARCRTGFFGVRLERCPEDHETTFRFNACHHRSCPQCNALPRQRWLESTLPRLLPVAHRQVVFTIAHELLPLYQHNTALLIQVLFESVAWVLQRHLSDPKRLGATAGFILAYHSWGRNLSLHPHIHALISEGGINDQGKWIQAKTASFLPARAMMHSFRGRMISTLKERLREGALILPEGMNELSVKSLFAASYKKPWNVHVEKQYAHGAGLVKYLARYLRGGPVHSNQIRVKDAQVKLRYKDHRTGHRQSLLIDRSEFIRRLLTHVPPAHQPMVRHYGLYSNRLRKERELAQRQLNADTGNAMIQQHAPKPPEWLQKKGHCQTCGQRLEVTVMRTDGR